MAILKAKDARKLSDKERTDKLKELRLELIKANVAANKSGKIKIKEIKRTISRLMFMAKTPEKQ